MIEPHPRSIYISVANTCTVGIETFSAQIDEKNFIDSSDSHTNYMINDLEVNLGFSYEANAIEKNL